MQQLCGVHELEAFEELVHGVLLVDILQDVCADHCSKSNAKRKLSPQSTHACCVCVVTAEQMSWELLPILQTWAYSAASLPGNTKLGSV